MRIVDAEDPDTVAHPELEDAQALQVDPVTVVVEVDGVMSWYFFGGFSAYAMVPSGRLENHSG